MSDKTGGRSAGRELREGKAAGRKIAGGSQCRPAKSPELGASGEVLGTIDVARKRDTRLGAESTYRRAFYRRALSYPARLPVAAEIDARLVRRRKRHEGR